MRRPPSLAELPRFPVSGGLSILALLASLLKFSGRDLSRLYMHELCFWAEPWRLLTSAVVHGDPLHLLFNLYWLWVFGTLLEATLGHFATLALCLVLMIGSGAAQFALGDGGIGLSGVGYGMFGMLFVLSRRDPRFRGAVNASTARLFGYWFVICVVATQLGLLRIGNTAHAVGAALGALLGLALDRAQKASVRVLGSLGLVLLSAASLAGASSLRPYVNLAKDAGLESGQLGYDALGANRLPQARVWLERSVRLSKREPSLWHNLGIVRARSGDDVGAEAAFAKAVELAPDNATYRQALEWIKERRAQPPEPAQSR